MTETQADYDTDAGPMLGSWVVERSGDCWVVKEYTTDSTGRYIYEYRGERGRKTARLIAAAGTAAQEAREMGHDPVEAIKAVPKLIEVLQPDTPVAKALRALKGAADYIEQETDNQLGAGRLHRLADEAADTIGLEITQTDASAEGSGDD